MITEAEYNLLEAAVKADPTTQKDLERLRGRVLAERAKPSLTERLIRSLMMTELAAIEQKAVWAEMDDAGFARRGDCVREYLEAATKEAHRRLRAEGHIE